LTIKDRIAQSALVGYCKECRVYDPDVTKGPCPMDCGLRVKKRRFLLCSECSGSYVDQKAFDDHECFDWE